VFEKVSLERFPNVGQQVLTFSCAHHVPLLEHRLAVIGAVLLGKPTARVDGQLVVALLDRRLGRPGHHRTRAEVAVVLVFLHQPTLVRFVAEREKVTARHDLTDFLTVVDAFCKVVFARQLFHR